MIAHTRCPVCDTEDSFIEFNQRPFAKCGRCKSLERHRIMWLALEHLGVLVPGTRVLHFAPEVGIAARIAEKVGQSYTAADLNAPGYYGDSYKAIKLDMCHDLGTLPKASVDLVLHNHVLEHVGCSVRQVLTALDALLAPGGVHMFSIPIEGPTTQEDLSPELPESERVRRFGQHDHLRMFGRDVYTLLQTLWPDVSTVDLNEFTTPQSRRYYGIPEQVVGAIGPHTIFIRKKPD